MHCGQILFWLGLHHLSVIGLFNNEHVLFSYICIIIEILYFQYPIGMMFSLILVLLVWLGYYAHHMHIVIRVIIW